MFLKKVSFKIVLAVAGVLAVFLPGFVKVQKLLYRNRELQVQINNLKKDNTALSQELYKLQHDPVYLEKVAREELRLGKEGEIIYKVAPEKK